MSPSLPHAVRARLERDPDRPAFAFRSLTPGSCDEELSLGELWSRAEAWAAALQELPRGARVLLVQRLGTRLVAAHLGCQLAGLVPTIFAHPSPKLREEVYRRNLTHALGLIAPAAVVIERRFLPALEGLTARRVVDEEVPERVGSEAVAWRSLGPDDPAVVQHSSGSTGLQKGVLLTQGMVLAQVEAYGHALGLDPARDRVAAWLPLYHDMGLFTSWLIPLGAGLSVTTLDPFEWVQDPGSILRLLAERGGTLCWQPNFAYDLLAARVRDEELVGLDLSGVRALINCAEPVRAPSQRRLLQRLVGCGLRPEALWTCYAMAENAFAVTSAGQPGAPLQLLRCDPDALARGRAQEVAPPARGVELVSVGVPIPGCEVRVVGPGREVLPEGAIGEVALRGPSTLREYLGNPAATAAALDPAGWFHSGDLGFLHQGQLWITGRQKDLLIVGGRNFYPQDLEAVVDGCPHAIAGRSVALGVEDEASGTQRVLVLVESHAAGEPAAREELAREVRRRVQEELDCPVSEVGVVAPGWLEKTSSGKLARGPNLERWRREEAARAPTTAPQDGPGEPGWLESLAWAAGTAGLLYLAVVLAPNWSWGVYAGF